MLENIRDRPRQKFALSLIKDTECTGSQRRARRETHRSSSVSAWSCPRPVAILENNDVVPCSSRAERHGKSPVLYWYTLQITTFLFDREFRIPNFGGQNLNNRVSLSKILFFHPPINSIRCFLIWYHQVLLHLWQFLRFGPLKLIMKILQPQTGKLKFS